MGAAGRKELLLKQLKDQFGCRTIEEAQDKLRTWTPPRIAEKVSSRDSKDRGV